MQCLLLVAVYTNVRTEFLVYRHADNTRFQLTLADPKIPRHHLPVRGCCRNNYLQRWWVGQKRMTRHLRSQQSYRGRRSSWSQTSYWSSFWCLLLHCRRHCRGKYSFRRQIAKCRKCKLRRHKGPNCFGRACYGQCRLHYHLIDWEHKWH